MNDSPGAATATAGAARSAAIRRALWGVLGLNLAVAAAKLIYGTLTGAISMVADGIHSTMDTSSTDGMTTMETSKAFEPDVAFLDIGMPRMNGYDAGRALREQFGPRIRLVAVTGWGQEADKRRAADASFDHHLTKPVDMHAVEQLLLTTVDRGASPAA